jgi:carbonic anhydrase
MKFCTALNCIDGRAQLPVILYLQNRFQVDYVDMITEPGMNRLLGRNADPELVERLLEKVDISLQKHNSVGIAVAGHHDCAGNPVTAEEQQEDIRQALSVLRECYAHLEVIGLWLDDRFTVHELKG